MTGLDIAYFKELGVQGGALAGVVILFGWYLRATVKHFTKSNEASTEERSKTVESFTRTVDKLAESNSAAVIRLAQSVEENTRTLLSVKGSQDTALELLKDHRTMAGGAN